MDMQKTLMKRTLAWLKAQKQTIKTRLKLLQYKWLMRVYITPVSLHNQLTSQMFVVNVWMRKANYSIVYGNV